jgi:hypothetical protein
MILADILKSNASYLCTTFSICSNIRTREILIMNKRLRSLAAGSLLGALCLIGLSASKPSLASEDDTDRVLGSLKTLNMMVQTLDFMQEVTNSCRTKACSDDEFQAIWNKVSISSNVMYVNPRSYFDQDKEFALNLAKSLSPQQAQEYIAATQSYVATLKQLEKAIIAERGPSFAESARQYAVVSSLKANMHTFQTIVETYAVDWGGVYPDNVKMLKTEAIVPGREYWKNFQNPYTGKTGEGQDGSYMDYKTFQNLGSQKALAGLVLYEQTSTTSYNIRGTDANGKILQKNGQDFILTNS